MFLQIVLDLLIQLRKAFKMNMTANSVEVKVHVSARHRHAYIVTHNYMIGTVSSAQRRKKLSP